MLRYEQLHSISDQAGQPCRGFPPSFLFVLKSIKLSWSQLLGIRRKFNSMVVTKLIQYIYLHYLHAIIGSS